MARASLDWRRYADLDVEERYWRRRLLAAERADAQARGAVSGIAREFDRVPSGISDDAVRAQSDLQRISRQLARVLEARARRDAGDQAGTPAREG